MRQCSRGAAPSVLTERGATWTKEFVERRTRDPKAPFRWPEYQGRPVSQVIRETLRGMTDEHCSYCDGFPLRATAPETIDHFRPKSWPEFWGLAYEWENLFLCCPQCQQSKRDTYQVELLRPDEKDYRFERYFVYDDLTGELSPNPGATVEDQERARVSIDVFGLNGSGRCSARRRELVHYRRVEHNADVDVNDWAYRFLIESVEGFS